MSDNVVRIRIMVVLLLVAVATVVWSLGAGFAGAQPTNDNLLKVHFLDVGQGDATFIESPDGVQVLIDGGKDSSVLRELGKVMGWRDRTIDLLIATHPDGDHIGGLIDVLRRYEVATIMITDNETDSPVAPVFFAAVEAEGAEVVYAEAGQVFELGASTTLEILFPVGSVSEMETNASSIAAQLQFGEIEFLFTGDAPKSIEAYLVDTYGSALASEVLKVGHHGSKTSTAETFVTAVDPDFAVISAAKDNPYGHPHEEVINVLDDVVVLGTYDAGTTSFLSNGREVWQK
ncbi:MAG: MBL fold metallo-hydrolase [Patescibacteria group bacterium]